jgi:hypothetical protein
MLKLEGFFFLKYNASSTASVPLKSMFSCSVATGTVRGYIIEIGIGEFQALKDELKLLTLSQIIMGEVIIG